MQDELVIKRVLVFRADPSIGTHCINCHVRILAYGDNNALLVAVGVDQSGPRVLMGACCGSCSQFDDEELKQEICKEKPR